VVVLGEDFLPYATGLGFGVYELSDENGCLQERAVRDNPYSRVTSITENEEDLLTGDVLLEEGHNIDLDILPASNGISIRALPGAGIGVDCGEGCRTSFPPTDLVPYGPDPLAVWDYKLYGYSTRPPDFFLETFDDSDFSSALMPFRRGVGGSQKDFHGMHVYAEGTSIVCRKRIVLPDNLAGLIVEIGMGFDDYIEGFWNEIPFTPLIGAGAPL
jgi:hypothetical protein